jgi:hypothetical protein
MSGFGVAGRCESGPDNYRVRSHAAAIVKSFRTRILASSLNALRASMTEVNLFF